MFGDWIKWVKGLTRRPEIVRISSALGADRRRTACAAMELWEWADEVTADGIVMGVTPAFVDDHVGLPGFFDAMSSVGWIKQVPGGIEFVNFSRHNGASAKRRAMDAERKAGARDSVRKVSAKCPQTKRTECGPEKRREEKRIHQQQQEARAPNNATRNNTDDHAAAAADYQLRAWAEGQAKKPDWLPDGKPWIAAGVWLATAQACPTVTREQFDDIIREAKASRNTLANPAGFVLARLKALSKG